MLPNRYLRGDGSFVRFVFQGVRVRLVFNRMVCDLFRYFRATIVRMEDHRNGISRAKRFGTVFIAFIPNLFRASIVFFYRFGTTVYRMISLCTRRFMELTTRYLASVAYDAVMFLGRFMSNRLCVIGNDLFAFRVGIRAKVQDGRYLFGLLSHVHSVLFKVAVKVCDRGNFNGIYVLLRFHGSFVG